MSRSEGRTFSFDNDDEVSLSALNANRHSYLSHDDNAFRDMQPPSPPAYTDSPTRRYNNSPPSPPTHRPNTSTAYQLPEDTDLNPPSPRPRVHVNTRQAWESTQGARGLDHSTSNRTASTITPGADNMGEAAGGGIAGIAYGVANTNERESGVEALRSLENIPEAGRGIPPERDFDTLGTSTPYVPAPPPSNRGSYARDPFSSPAPSTQSNPFDDRRMSGIPSPGALTPRAHRSSNSIPMAEYQPPGPYNDRPTSLTDGPYNRYSSAWDHRVGRGDINPDEIDDDEDDGMVPRPLGQRKSYMGMGGHPERGLPQGTAAGSAGGIATGGVLGALGGLVGRSNNIPNGSRDPSGQYGPVPGSSSGPGFDNTAVEKSPWLTKQTSGSKRIRWIIGILGLLIVLGAIAGGIAGGLHKKASDSSSDDSSTPAKSNKPDSDLDLDSPEVKKLMNNPDLHKVFPGMDYTPFNAQYPECLSNMPTQDNVTMDVAVLSQLTNAIRLYGTDCNQTEMVLHAIDKLKLTSMKVWLGVWLDNNSTTNDRGTSAMYDILSKSGADPFAGVIVGNELIYRKQHSEQEIIDTLKNVKQNLTAQKIDLPVATSDLGDAWTSGLAAASDFVMSNIHPFFAGVPVDQAAGWTWSFWQQKDTPLVTDKSKNVIAETGWPSAGGTDCGTDATTCAPGTGSVAGINEMNQFMGDFVCQALNNRTNFFWYILPPGMSKN